MNDNKMSLEEQQAIEAFKAMMQQTIMQAPVPFTDPSVCPYFTDPDRVMKLKPDKPFVKHFSAGGFHPIRKKFMSYRATIALAYDKDENKTYAALSVCSPNDRFDSRLGHARAVGRLKSPRYRVFVQEGDTVELSNITWAAFVDFWRTRVDELYKRTHS